MAKDATLQAWWHLEEMRRCMRHTAELTSYVPSEIPTSRVEKSTLMSFRRASRAIVLADAHKISPAQADAVYDAVNRLFGFDIEDEDEVRKKFEEHFGKPTKSEKPPTPKG